MTRNSYEIGGSVRNPATRSATLAQIGKIRPALERGRMRSAFPEMSGYPEVTHHG